MPASEKRPSIELGASVPLVRAVVLLVVFGAFAVLARRAELVVLAAPFAVWCALGTLRRIDTARNADAPAEATAGTLVVQPEEVLSTRRLAVGQIAEYRISTPQQDMILALHIPRPPRSDVEPALGGIVGRGSAAIKIRPQRWGRQSIEPVETSISDSWGMWTGFWTPRTDYVTVAPGLDTPGGGDAIPHPIGLVGIHSSRTRGDGSDLAEIRAFATGDRLKRINWRVTSRTGTLHTNATTAERDTEVLLVLDTLSDITTETNLDDIFAVADSSSRNATALTANSSLDIAVSAAATIADHYLGLGDRVAVHDLGRVIGSLPAGSGSRQRAIITERLAKGWVDHAVPGALRPVGRVRPGSLVLCCTPLLNPDVVDEVLRMVHRGAAVLVIDTLPPGLGRLESVARIGGWRQRLEDRLRSNRFWTEAWALRRLEREQVVDGLNRIGVPVVEWQGISSLGQMIAALAANRTAPRMARR